MEETQKLRQSVVGKDENKLRKAINEKHGVLNKTMRVVLCGEDESAGRRGDVGDLRSCSLIIISVMAVFSSLDQTVASHIIHN